MMTMCYWTFRHGVGRSSSTSEKPTGGASGAVVGALAPNIEVYVLGEILRGPSGAGTEGLPPPHHAGRGLRRPHGSRCRDGPAVADTHLARRGAPPHPAAGPTRRLSSGWPPRPVGSSINPMWILRMH